MACSSNIITTTFVVVVCIREKGSSLVAFGCLFSGGGGTSSLSVKLNKISRTVSLTVRNIFSFLLTNICQVIYSLIFLAYSCSDVRKELG